MESDETNMPPFIGLASPRPIGLGDPQALAERIVALEAELANEREKFAFMTQQCREAQDIARDAQAEVERLRVNDARYRWLRDNVRDASGDIDDRLYVACDDYVYRGRWALDGAELDVAIDAALAAKDERKANG